MMELLALDVDQFGCISHASVRFKSGLNVLHGSNEIGKSSLARAIRFALLLPSTSSAVDEWIPWTGGGDPAVTLTFRKAATEYFRVRKVFGTTTALLERSPNGSTNTWTTIARAREVEARLRALLEWGVPEPGGAKAPKGLPESFLAGALLAEQDAVTEIFDRNLEKDGSDSGRARIRAALQAIAQDPLVKSVLDAAQARVDEAFTATGRRKSGGNDPFPKMTKELAARRAEHEAAVHEADAAKGLARQVADLQKAVADAESKLEEATAFRIRVEELHQAQLALRAATDARRKGQVLIDAVAEAKAKVYAATMIVRDIEPRLPVLIKGEENSRKTYEAATAKASAGREKRRAELAQEDVDILRERENLRLRQTAVDAALALQNALALEAQAKQLAGETTGLEKTIAILDAVEPWMELQEQRISLTLLDARAKEAGDLVNKTKKLREEAAAAWSVEMAALLPTAERLDELRQLRNKVDVANAKLDVGIAVDVRGAASLSLEVDGMPREGKSSPLSVEATSVVRLQFSDAVEVEIRGGRSGDRALAEALRKQWSELTEPIFLAARVANFDSLVEAWKADAERRATADALEREAANSDAKRVGMGDPLAGKPALVSRIAELEARLVGLETLTIEEAARTYGKRSRSIKENQRTERDSKKATIARLLAQAAAHRDRASASAAAGVAVDASEEAAAIATRTTELNERERAITEERKALDAPRGKRDALEEAAIEAKRLLDEAVASVNTSKTECEVWAAREQERSAAASNVQLEALKKAEDDAKVKVGETPEVDEAVIAKCRVAEQGAEARLEMLVGSLQKAEGALLGSGGVAADELVRDLEVALKRAHEKQAALEDEYEAWRLLCESLKEAERTQATHLGSVLAPELATRFQSLAGTRYAGIALGPHLNLEGIQAAGDRRSFERLSIGTREQLSTLFRLCLAERLRTALLLDDQLVQSDPDRLRWFRKALRDTAESGVQVIVLTCRPDDYLEPAETPAPHVINLGQVVALAQ